MKFFSNFTYQMDERGRILIPSRFLKGLGGVGAEVMVARCSDGCIYLCSPGDWQEVKKELGESPYPETVQIKKSGKISLPKSFREYAGLEKEVVVAGCGDHIELWNEKRWATIKREAEKERELLF